jgi:lipoprotein-anchoring transpeptidase ErfK/SrfK
MTSHRRQVRPRYGRLTAAVSSLGVTCVAVLGGAGMLPSSAGEPAPRDAMRPAAAAPRQEAAAPESTPDAGERAISTPGERRRVTAADLLPEDSGVGRRAVFSEGQQRVWIVSGGGKVLRTYLVSGSIHDNLDPGTYQVYSRSMNAIGVDDSGTMKYFVRFTQGDSGAAIGFHDIPVDEGEKVQTVEELGEPTSHGCIRQKRADAKAMWDFAGIGTTVVVTP